MSMLGVMNGAATLHLPELPEFWDLPEAERTATAKLLLDVEDHLLTLCCQLKEQVAQQDEQLGLQAEQIQALKDEIATLKGEKPRPKIKPSTLNKDQADESGDEGSGRGKKKGKRGKPLRKKTQELAIHEEVYIHPEHLPAGSVFKGYEDYVVQDIEIKPKNTKFRRARYDTPAGERLVGPLPESLKGTHFAPTLQSFILSQLPAARHAAVDPEAVGGV